MTVALSDTKLLCDMLQPLPDFTDSIATANQTAEFYTKRKPLSATINTLANALYKVCISPLCLSVRVDVCMCVCLSVRMFVVCLSVDHKSLQALCYQGLVCL